MLIKSFQERVAQNPDKIAVKTKEREITYDALNRLSNAIAHVICSRFGEGLDSERAVLLFEHGIDMIVGTLGALKADRVYVPFDPAYPESRLLFMLNHSEAALLITNDTNLKLAEALAAQACRSIDILNIDNLGENIDVTDWVRAAKGEHLAYLLYTSGSTGMPKGIIQNHQNVVYFVSNYIEQHGIDSRDRMTLFSAFSHDAAVIDIYSGLLSGATLYPLNVRRQINIEALHGWLDTEQITIWHSVPTLFRYFANTLSGKEKPLKLRHIVLGGESVVEQDAAKVKRLFKGVNLVNLYGQSESSYNSSQRITDETEFEGINLGEPIKDTRVLVINDKGRVAAPFSAGEIVIASEHLALGYWRDPEKTEKVFEMHPELGRIYRTGDLGRFDEEGYIEYLGRKDFQIKIRGYRVELEEVENCLLKHGAIREAAVIGKHDDDGSKYLCGFFTTDDELKIEEVSGFLSKELPDYMIPPFLKRLDVLPLTPTGKVDRKALLEMQQMVYSEKEFEAPRNDLEKKLALIWRELLGIDRIGINDSFFALGGHSLKASKLVAQIHKELNVELPLRELFKTPTIKGLSAYIEGKKENRYIAIEPLAALMDSKAQFYELSSAQKRMYILQQLDLNSTSYNLPSAFIIEGTLDVDRLNAIMQTLVNRHEVLRTSFKQLDGRLVQQIHQAVSFDITCEQAEIDQEEEIIIRDRIRAFVEPFDLRQAPLLRACLVKLAINKHLFLFDMHHIISDGLSIGILYDEIFKLYRRNLLPELRIQYKDYAAWQNRVLGTEFVREQETYWLERLSGEIPLLNIRTDYPRPSRKSYSGDTVHMALSTELGKAVKRLAEQNDVTLYMVLLAAYTILLHKYTEQEDILVGTPVAGRRHADLDKLLGMFVNTLVMRNAPSGSKTAKEFIAEVKENALSAFENQDYPFEELVEKLNVRRDLSRNPLFDTLFSLQNISMEQNGLDTLKVAPFAFENRISKFDLSLTVLESNAGIDLSFEYCASLFLRDSITQLALAYVNILEQMASEQDQKLAAITILQEEEKSRILYDFNNTCSEYLRGKTIHELFEMQVRRTPNKIALVCGDACLTYETLNKKANQLARLLREKNVGPDRIVGIMTKRSLEMIIGIMAILKAGGAYLPIDPEYPANRVDYMLEDSGTDLLLTQADATGKLLTDKLVLRGDVIDIGRNDIYEGDVSDCKSISHARDLAYVIYTSGSTGKPKGTMVEHRSVVNFFHGITEKINMDSKQAILALTTISFDIFVLETLLPLSKGLKIVIADENQQLDSKRLADLIEANHVEILQITPSRMQLLLRNANNAAVLNRLKVIMIGGEAFPNYLLTDLKKYTNARIYNMYGPTETTVWSTVGEQTDNKAIDIGKPIANTRIYILDDANGLKPVGIPGELCIAGDGVARGYLNKPELTAERFIPDPFHKGQKMYRTGDAARFLSDGRLEYIGRTDGQVKIRGYRIEIGEIEKQLSYFEDIIETAVSAKSDQEGNRFLVAYYTAAAEIPIPALREHLSKSLPEYMVPAHFMHLDKLPLTPNGKIHRKALPEPDFKRPKLLTSYQAAETEAEIILANIWKHILNCEWVGVHDNFFDIGGNSLLLVKMHGELEKYYPDKIKIADIFAYPTISKLSSMLEGEDKNRARGFNIKMLKLPQTFFSEVNEKEGGTFHMSLDDYSQNRIMEIARKHGVSSNDILLGAFVYVLYEMSGRQTVPVNAVIGGSEALLPLYFEFEGIRSILDLILQVKQAFQSFDTNKLFPLKSFEQLHLNKKPGDAALLYLHNCDEGQKEVFNQFDLVLKVFTDHEQLRIRLEYDTYRISQAKVKELANYYVKSIETIIERMI